MQKFFTKEIIQALKVIVLGLVLGLGVSVVSADWVQPSAQAPTCQSGNPGCDAPINVSSSNQSKDGPALASKFNVYGIFSADKVLAFNQLWVKSNTVSPISPTAIQFGGRANIDLSDWNQDPAVNGNARDAIQITGGPRENSVGIITNKPQFYFWNTPGNGYATVQAKNIQLTDGTQGEGKALVSDANGLSSWKDITPPTPTVTVTGGDMDVVIMGHKRNVTNMSEFNTEAYCPASHPILLGGGGDCQSPAAIIQSHPTYPGNARPRTEYNYDIESNEPAQSGWTTVCRIPSTPNGKDVHSWAICGKLNPVSVVLNAPATPTPNWVPVGNGPLRGQDNISCLAWVRGLYPTHTISVNDLRVGTQTTLVGKCGYLPIGGGNIIYYPADQAVTGKYPVNNTNLQVNLY